MDRLYILGATLGGFLIGWAIGSRKTKMTYIHRELEEVEPTEIAPEKPSDDLNSHSDETEVGVSMVEKHENPVPGRDFTHTTPYHSYSGPIDGDGEYDGDWSPEDNDDPEEKVEYVDEEEWLLHETGYPEIEVTYYMGDGVLIDNKGNVVQEPVEPLVGTACDTIQMNLAQPTHRVYIRNHEYKLDIAVQGIENKYYPQGGESDD